MSESDRLFDVAADGCVLRLHVQPGAGRDAVAGTHGDALKVRVRSPAREGAANAAVVSLVADLLDVPRRDVVLVAGQRSRSKRVHVSLDKDRLGPRLDALISASPQRKG